MKKKTLFQWSLFAGWFDWLDWWFALSFVYFFFFSHYPYTDTQTATDNLYGFVVVVVVDGWIDGWWCWWWLLLLPLLSSPPHHHHYRHRIKSLKHKHQHIKKKYYTHWYNSKTVYNFVVCIIIKKHERKDQPFSKNRGKNWRLGKMEKNKRWILMGIGNGRK